ncbi:Putative RTA-like protein [Colletotrichum destructivum]|uniref:RTA-like protein n=1 Tax=Colletotrichum destructivum TaxID=34406 RepID=A0AAX4IRA5_9PEZI|nr:Putative RTA-like protein [Colletotrichum destructivum]
MATQHSSTPTSNTASVASATSSGARPSCTTAVPGQYGSVPIDACNSYYPFDPSFEGNLAFAVIFGLSLVAHVTQAVVHRKRFCWVISMGASWECAAFILRSLGSRNQQEIGYQIGGQLLFLLAPLWINAFAYMLSARLVYFILPDQKVAGIKASALTKIFVTVDVVCFLVQAAGGAMMSNTDVSPDDPILRIGKHVYMSGCGLQLGFIVIFCGLMGRFYVKMRRAQRFDLDVRRIKAMVWVVYVVLVLIVIRIIFRLVEFGPGADIDNPILTNENYAFGLDALPMVLALVLLNAVHPGIVLREENSEFPRPSRAEKKQAKLDRNAAKRESKLAKKAAKNEKKAGIEVDDGEYVIMEERSPATDQHDSGDRAGATGRGQA